MQIDALSNDGTTPDGALVRHESVADTGLVSLESVLAMRPEPGVVVTFRQHVEYHRTVRDWIRWHASFEPGGHRIAVERDDLGLESYALPVIPSFARYLLILELAASAADRLEYLQVDEMAPDRPRHAVLTRKNTGTVRMPDGEPRTAMRIDLIIDGSPMTAYWCDTAGVLKGEFVQDCPDPIGRVTGTWWRTTWQDLTAVLDDEVRTALEATGLLTA